MRVIYGGLVEYQRALERQKDFVREVRSGAEDVLFMCEHPAVLTLGRAYHRENILASYEFLAARGVSVVEVDRGGDVTLHAPGQLVVYPVLELKSRGRDLGVYLQKLEQATVDFLLDFGIVAQGDNDRRGVWVAGSRGRCKIASIGIGVSHWVTFHGVGLNISTDLALFKLIRPCGLDVAMTSVKELTNQSPLMPLAAEKFADKFLKVFDDTDHSS